MTQHDHMGAIFDLDGVIANTARYHFLSWQSIADEEGFAIPAVVDDRVKGVDRMASLNIVLEYAPKTYSAAEKETLAARKNDRYVEMITSLTPADILPGAADLLAILKSAGVGIALASASKNARPVLKALGISDHFDFIADAAYVKKPKPHPEIFLTAAKGLGLAPEECVGIEDAEAGVTAIKDAGMFALGVGDATLLQKADVVVADLTEVNAADYFKLT